MRARPTLAAGALTALATLALAGLHTPAQAAYHHHEAGRSAAAARGVDPSVTPGLVATTTSSGLVLSASTIAPGNVVVQPVGKGGVEVVSLGSGYSVKDLAQDFGALFKGDVKTIRRVDKKVTFWGGTSKGVEFGVDLPAGSYYVVNLDKQRVAPLTVSGTPTATLLPATSGKVKMVGDMTFKAQRTLPHRGWVELKNKASEPHFVDFTGLRKGTTKGQVRRFLMSGAQGQPSFVNGRSFDALVVSPGHSFTYYLDAPRGEYAELCFYPSKKTGMPHSLMGMFDVSTLE